MLNSMFGCRLADHIRVRSKATLSYHCPQLKVANLALQQSDVIIIGAGISGLAAGASLKNEGYRTIILEAKERIGNTA